MNSNNNNNINNTQTNQPNRQKEGEKNTASKVMMFFNQEFIDRKMDFKPKKTNYKNELCKDLKELFPESYILDQMFSLENDIDDYILKSRLKIQEYLIKPNIKISSKLRTHIYSYFFKFSANTKDNIADKEHVANNLKQEIYTNEELENLLMIINNEYIKYLDEEALYKKEIDRLELINQKESCKNMLPLDAETQKILTNNNLHDNDNSIGRSNNTKDSKLGKVDREATPKDVFHIIKDFSNQNSINETVNNSVKEDNDNNNSYIKHVDNNKNINNTTVDFKYNSERIDFTNEKNIDNKEYVENNLNYEFTFNNNNNNNILDIDISDEPYFDMNKQFKVYKNKGEFFKDHAPDNVYWHIRIQGKVIFKSINPEINNNNNIHNIQHDNSNELTAINDNTNFRKFTYFFNKIIFKFESVEGTPDISDIEWTRNQNDTDGFDIRRKIKDGVPNSIKIIMHYNNYCQKYVITNNDLSDILGIDIESKSKILYHLWYYIKINSLQDKDNNNLILNNKQLFKIFKTDKMEVNSLPNRIINYIKPLESIEETICLKMSPSLNIRDNEKIIDLNVYIDDPNFIRITHILSNVDHESILFPKCLFTNASSNFMKGDGNKLDKNNLTDKFYNQLNEYDKQISDMIDKINKYKYNYDFYKEYLKNPTKLINNFLIQQNSLLKIMKNEASVIDTRFDYGTSNFYKNYEVSI